jgi:hypothetical protein
MEINLSNDILKNIEKASKELNIPKNEVVARAVLLYLRNLKAFESLQDEIEEWEEAGIEDNLTWEENNLKDE